VENIKKEHLQKGLKERHVNLIAIGGSVGIGLFLASGNAIAISGPCLLLSYASGTFFMFFIIRALGKVATEYPVAGSFSYYADRIYKPFCRICNGLVTYMVGFFVCDL
jgi:L-asparagine transporter-like permease